MEPGVETARGPAESDKPRQREQTHAPFAWKTPHSVTRVYVSPGAFLACRAALQLSDAHFFFADECVVSERVGRVYAKHGVRDDCPDTDITAIFPKCIEFIRSAHAAGGSVVVHCLEGVSRSVCVAVAYMCSTGMTPDQAFDAVRAVRAIDVFPRYEADTRAWVVSEV